MSTYSTSKIDMRYTCPRCGHDIGDFFTVIHSDSSFICCPNCGWSKGDNFPYGDKHIYYNQSSFIPIPKACQNCPNHPSNGGSGICHCILGTPIIT